MPFHRSSLWTLVGILLASATGVVMWLSRRPVAAPDWPVEQEATASVIQSEFRRPPKPGHPGWVDLTQYSEEMPPADASVAPASLPKKSRAAEAEDWSHYQPTPEELAYRASKVELEANKELGNLLQVLDLDDAQQDRVFAALARRSAFYHPSLQPLGQDGAPLGPLPTQPEPTQPVPTVPDAVAAVPPPPVEEAAPPPAALPVDPVLAELTPEQVDVYERYTSERDAFWVGVVEDVEQEINAQ